METKRKFNLSKVQIEALRLLAIDGAFLEPRPAHRASILRVLEPSSARSWGRRERLGGIGWPTQSKLASLGLIERTKPGRYDITDAGREAAHVG